jgi:hypothetical protein
MSGTDDTEAGLLDRKDERGSTFPCLPETLTARGLCHRGGQIGDEQKIIAQRTELLNQVAGESAFGNLAGISCRVWAGTRRRFEVFPTRFFVMEVGIPEAGDYDNVVGTMGRSVFLGSSA